MNIGEIDLTFGLLGGTWRWRFLKTGKEKQLPIERKLKSDVLTRSNSSNDSNLAMGAVFSSFSISLNDVSVHGS